MATSPQSKTKQADPAVIAKVQKLLRIAAGQAGHALVGRATLAKLYEILVLIDVLKRYRAHGGQVIVKSPGNTPMFRLAGNPCKASKGKYTYFELRMHGFFEYEVWLSVQFETLSCVRTGGATGALSDMHEIDVGVFEAPLPQSSYPSYQQICAGFSCKYTPKSKMQVREVLGLRRETACLDSGWTTRARWLLPDNVTADPASPMFLASSDPDIGDYQTPVDSIGVYMRHIPFVP